MAKERGFGKIDKEIMLNSDLSIESRAIYAILATYAGKDRACFPSVQKLLKDTGISKDRFYKYMHELEQKNIVRKSTVKSDKSRFGQMIYHLNDFRK